MKGFAKVVFIVFLVKSVNGELEFCEKENEECKINETTDLSILIKHASTYFSNLHQKYYKKINAIADDIDVIKENIKFGSTNHIGTYGGPLKTLEPPKSLYDNLWVIIQRRQDGGVGFFRSWVHYVVGFGNPLREFFIGLDKLHALTSSRPHELIIKLEDFKGNQKYARYDEFLVGNNNDKYKLKKLGNYSGNAGDYLRSHVGMFFSTRDKDNDASENLHCAKLYQGGWWYNNCMTSNLNGPFRTRYEVHKYNMTWGKLNGTQYKLVQMMIRSKEFKIN